MLSTKQAMTLYFQAIGPARHRYRAILTFSGRFIYMDRKPSTEYEFQIDQHAKKLIPYSILVVFLMIVSFSLILIGPIYAHIANGDYASPTGVILPFIDPHTEHGYAINLIIQFASASVTLLGIVCIEVGNCLINDTYKLMAHLVRFNVRKFSDNLRQGTFSYQNKIEFRNILVQLQDLEFYLAELNDIYYWKFFLQPILTTGCVSLSVFAQTVVSY